MRHAVAPLSVCLFLAFAGVSLAEEDAFNGIKLFERGEYSAAFDALSPLAKAGDPRAQYYLGEIYRQGRGHAQSITDALDLFKHSAEAGNADALNALGELYLAGIGVNKDTERARVMFEKAISGSSLKAYINLAYLY